MRRAVLGLVYREALAGKGKVTVDQALAHAKPRLKEQDVDRSAVEAGLHQLASEFDAEVSSDDDGALVFTFSAIRRQFAASETMRQQVKLQDRTLGEIVYSSADSPMEALDRELEAGDLDLSGYLRSPDLVGFEDDYEVVAFEEELKLGA